MKIVVHISFQIKAFIFSGYVSRSVILDHMVDLFLIF